MSASLMYFPHTLASRTSVSRTVAAAGILVVLLHGTSRAEQIPALCSEAANQAEMHRCADQHLRKENAEMAKTVQELLKETDEDDRKYVTDAQAAWQAYADKECFSRIGGSPNRGGTIWPTLHLQCHVGLTQQRIKDLKEQVECPGGRLNC